MMQANVEISDKTNESRIFCQINLLTTIHVKLTLFWNGLTKIKNKGMKQKQINNKINGKTNKNFFWIFLFFSGKILFCLVNILLIIFICVAVN